MVGLALLAGALAVSASPWTRYHGEVSPQALGGTHKDGIHFELDFAAIKRALLER